jgi:hypothetical protein
VGGALASLEAVSFDTAIHQWREGERRLADLYDSGTGWCLDVAVEVAPGAPWAWDSRTTCDAAFARYVREAVDFAGGRRVEMGP